MGINQFVVDPVAAALRKFVHIQFARGQHDFAHRAVNLVAINVDVGKVVVSANLLDLAQCILERVPVPQANILQRCLIVGRVGGIDRDLGGKLSLQEAVQAVGLLRHLDVMNDVGLLANQLVRLDDKAGNIPAHQRNPCVTNHGRSNSRHQPANTWRQRTAQGRNQRPQHQSRTHQKHTGERDVRACVGDAVEDRVVFEELLEAANIHAQSDDEQQKCNRDGEPA